MASLYLPSCTATVLHPPRTSGHSVSAACSDTRRCRGRFFAPPSGNRTKRSHDAAAWIGALRDIVGRRNAGVIHRFGDRFGD